MDPQYSDEDNFRPDFPWRDNAQFLVGGGLRPIPEKVGRGLFSDEDWGVPWDSYLGRALRYGERQTDGSTNFMLLAGLSTLAVASGRKLDTALFAGGETLANLWVILAGPSATARKTTCLNLETKLLSEVAPRLLVGKPGSGPGLMRRLAAEPITLMALGEFGDLLAATAAAGGTSFYAQVKESLTKFFDGMSETVSYAKETIAVHNPRLSILAASAPKFLQDHSTPRDWEGGFYSRFLMVYGDRERSIRVAHQTPETLAGRRKNLEWLRRLVDPEAPEPLAIYTPDGFEDDALDLWSRWGDTMEQRFEVFKQKPAITSALGRVDLHTAKVVLLLSLNAGLCHQVGWKIRAREVAAAIRLVDALHVPSVIPIIEMAQDNDVQRWKAEIRGILGDGKEHGVGDFTEPLGLLAPDVDRLLRTLALEGHLSLRSQDGLLLARKPVKATEMDWPASLLAAARMHQH